MRTALAVLGLLAAALVAALGSLYREPLPLDHVSAARTALRRARIEAAGPAPEELARAVDLAQVLERRLAEERAKRWRPPQSAEIRRLALNSEAAAQAALDSARARERRNREAVAARRAEIEEKLSLLGPAIERLVDVPLRAAFQRARLDVEAAEHAEARGDLPAAAAGLEEAARELDGVEQGLDRSHARLHRPDLRRLWQGWVDATVAESRRAGAAAVIVDKLARRCVLLSQGRVVESYKVELGRNGLDDKLYAGDQATPEGRYRVTERRDRGATLFYRALMLDYPTAEDRREFAEARRLGLVPKGRGVGGLIEIHGHGGKGMDWTNGCVALANDQMDHLFAAVEVGTPVTIVGTARLPEETP
jgi:hypothetical protein